MSNREMAYSLIDRMTDEQVSSFIILFGGYAKAKTEDDNAEQKKDPEKAREAFERLNKMIRPAPPDFDPEKEREEYYKEKYGI